MTQESIHSHSDVRDRLSGAMASWSPDSPEVPLLLQTAEITSCELLPWGSNYTFLVRLEQEEHGSSFAVYKPRRGEAPLYDFPEGTLYRREYAAYLLSRALGWDIVPPTVIRDGPYGTGSVQLFIPSVRGANYFTLREDRRWDFQRMAAFDCLANNADRKGGHCLLGMDGRIWGIDHGLTFNVVPKLRTVIWDFRSSPIPSPILESMQGLEKAGEAWAELGELLAPEEVRALQERLEQLLALKVYPEPGPWRSVPWPAI